MSRACDRNTNTSISQRMSQVPEEGEQLEGGCGPPRTDRWASLGPRGSLVHRLVSCNHYSCMALAQRSDGLPRNCLLEHLLQLRVRLPPSGTLRGGSFMSTPVWHRWKLMPLRLLSGVLN